MVVEKPPKKSNDDEYRYINYGNDRRNFGAI